MCWFTSSHIWHLIPGWVAFLAPENPTRVWVRDSLDGSVHQLQQWTVWQLFSKAWGRSSSLTFLPLNAKISTNPQKHWSAVVEPRSTTKRPKRCWTHSFPPQASDVREPTCRTTGFESSAQSTWSWTTCSCCWRIGFSLAFQTTRSPSASSWKPLEISPPPADTRRLSALCKENTLRRFTALRDNAWTVSRAALEKLSLFQKRKQSMETKDKLLQFSWEAFIQMDYLLWTQHYLLPGSPSSPHGLHKEA